jgi:hypothetical protein
VSRICRQNFTRNIAKINVELLTHNRRDTAAVLETWAEGGE